MKIFKMFDISEKFEDVRAIYDLELANSYILYISNRRYKTFLSFLF